MFLAASKCLSVLAVAFAAGLPTFGTARRSLAQAPASSSALADGLGPYLQQSPQYSLFYEIVQTLNGTTSYEDLVIGWFEGPTNQTLLLVNDQTLREGFAQLAEQYNVSDPSTFIDRLINLAAGNRSRNNTAADSTFDAAVLLVAFAETHTLQEPVNFYGDREVLEATYESPVNITTNIIEPFSNNADLQAYGVTDAPGPEQVYLRQAGGIFHSKEGLLVPRTFLQDTGVNASPEYYQYSDVGEAPVSLYVYELDGIFIFGGQYGAADTSGGQVSVALESLIGAGVLDASDAAAR